MKNILLICLIAIVFFFQTQIRAETQVNTDINTDVYCIASAVVSAPGLSINLPSISIENVEITTARIGDTTVAVFVDSCKMPKSKVELIEIAIKAALFGDDKMNVATQALTGKCVTVVQVKSIIKLFNFEDEKLAFAKYAYDYTQDKNNYYQVNSSFDFSSTKQELNEFVKGN